jgi:hypothetical protein
MENVRVGDIVKCVCNKNWEIALTLNDNYEVLKVEGEWVRVKGDTGNERWFLKEWFDVAARANLWVGGSGRSSNHFKIELPKVYLDGNEIDYGVSEFPDINIPKLAQRLYEGVQKDMKVMSIKQLHNDIKNIYFNEDKRTTVIVFKNGDKVKATASKDTPFSEYAGVVTALFKYEKGLKLKDVEHLIKKKRG